MNVHKITHVTGTAQSRLNYLGIPRAIISPQKPMSKFGIAHCHALYPNMVLVLLLAHHQVLCFSSLMKPDCCFSYKSLALQDYKNKTVFVTKTVTGICARSSVSSL